MGIVKKNAIMMVDFALELERQRGMDGVAAIRQAAVERFRPILMTTLATILGIVPIALALGAGAESRVSMGIAVIGGLVAGGALTLFVIPAIYAMVSARESAEASAEAKHRSGTDQDVPGESGAFAAK
jgi:multidrug efflux pump